MAIARRRVDPVGEPAPAPFTSHDSPKKTKARSSNSATVDAVIPPQRLKALEDGVRAERAAALHLTELGLTILGRNVRVGRYEIDLLARDGPVLVVVEVRSRGARAIVKPLDTISAAKRARLRRAATWLWRDRYSRDASFERVRFDCVGVTFDDQGETRVVHVRAAF